MPGSVQTNEAHPSKGFLRRAHSVFALLGGVYLLAVILLSIPFFQTHILYLNSVKIPFFVNYDAPEKYGLAPGKTLNLNITTTDGLTLGAWFVLSDPAYRAVPFPEPSTYPSLESRVPDAIKAHPTILFFHGNAATRAADYRIRYYNAFTSRLNANVLAIDYRGFGNSEGHPTEEGLAIDAHAAWDWLIAQGADSENVLIYGHSLGTAVAAKLSADLSARNVRFRGLVLMSPFSSIHTLLETYQFFGVLPLMKPLQLIPGAHDFVVRALVHTFNTLPVVPLIKSPVLLAHAEDDWDIPHTHSNAIFDTLLEPLLPPISAPPVGALTWPQERWNEFYAAAPARAHARKTLVGHTEIRNFGTVDQFFRSDGDKVVLLKMKVGGHNEIGCQEGLHEVIRHVFGLK